MQKIGIFLFTLFLLFGIVGHASLVIAETGSGSITSRNNSESGDDDSDSLEDEVEDEDETEDENETEDDSEISERTKTESKEVFIDDNGCKIKIERKIEIERGKRVEVVKKKMECPDGRRAEVQFKRENKTVNGEVRERIRYEVEGEDSIEVELEDEMEVEEEVNGTEYKLKAKLRNGNFTQIKIMPDRASAIAIERLKALNFTVELREVSDKENIPKVVYNIETNKSGRFLGVFKLKLKVEGQIDPETGEYLGTGKPWWAFLVAGEDSDQTNGATVDTTGNSASGIFPENSTDALNGTGAAQ